MTKHLQPAISASRIAINRQRREERKKRAYTMTDKAIAQRRTNAPTATAASMGHHTGPVTVEGKAASSRNVWIHGRHSAINRAHFGLGAASMAKMFGKPCVTTCPFHPENPDRTEAPCGLVLDGLTHAGGSCLDKTVYVHALDSLMAAMHDGEMDGMHGVLATEMAANLEIVDKIRQAIAEHGVYVATYERDRAGDVVLDPRDPTKPMVFDLKMNPAIIALAKFTETMGINFAELMATPRAREKLKDEDEAANAMQQIIGGIFRRAAKKLPPPTQE